MRTAVTVCCFAALLSQLPTSIDEVKAQQSGKVDEIKPFAIVQRLTIASGFTDSFAFSPDGQVLALVDGVQVRFWNLRSGKSAADSWRFETNPRITHLLDLRLAFMDSKTIVVSRNSNSITLREYPSGQEIHKIDLGQSMRSDGWVVAPGLIACTGYRDKKYGVSLWTGPKWQESWRAVLDEIPPSLTFSPDRSELAISTMKANTLRIYSVKDGKLLRAVDNKFSFVDLQNLSYVPGGREIACLSTGRPRFVGLPLRPTDPGPPGVAILDDQFEKYRIVPWGQGVVFDPMGCAFSGDGKTLIVPCRSNTVRLYEVYTGKLRHIGAMAPQSDHFRVSPDGKLFASVSNRRVFVMDWRAADPELPVREPADVWADLASPDATKGYRAVVALGAKPADAAKIIRDNLKPAAVPNAAAVNAWVVDLGADDFATREAAQKELAKLDELVEPELRAAAKDNTLERRNRANELLLAISRGNHPERLRAMRAVEVLEYTDTPAGREVLKSLASGTPSALLTRDAKAALERLKAFDPKP
jgi:hypothetical protein